jgi:hypothetical protein
MTTPPFVFTVFGNLPILNSGVVYLRIKYDKKTSEQIIVDLKRY